ncbi:MAG TPA: DUF4175 family protein [Bacteroidia bacterium]|jgi:hypothetical protein|nr:DUF4175 family protein [Bacteroidia bacterium]
MNSVQGNIIHQKLDEFIRKYYKNQLIRGLIYSVGLVLLFFISLSTLEYFAEFSTTIRTFIFYSFILTSGYVITKFIVIPILKLNSFGSVISHTQAAEIIGNHFSNVQDKLLNVLQLQNLQSSALSVELLNAGINQKITELKPVPFTSAIDLNENRKYLKYAAIPLLLLFSILIIAPKILSTGSKRLINHGTYFEKEAPFTFRIENKELKAVQQQNFTLKIRIVGDQVPAESFIVINGNEFKLDKENASMFTYTFKNVQKDVDFNLMGGGFSSKEYKLTALPKPILLGFEAQLKYPAYLNRKDEVVTNTGDMLVPQGTKITWTFNTKNSEGVALHFSDSSLNLTPIAENKFSFSRRFMQNAAYSINTQNKFVPKADSVNYSINVIPDAFPVVELNERRDSLKPNNIYFSGLIKDDYGFNRFNFHYKVYSSDTNGKAFEKAEEFNMPLQKGQLTQPFVHYIDLSRFELKAGDKIEYYFEVWDNDGVNGSKSARSNIMQFKAPTLEELDKNTQKNNNKIKDDLEESLKKAKELQKDISDLNKKMLEKKQLGWEDKKKLENLLEKQKELEKKVEQTKDANQQNNEEQNKYKQQDENILEKQKELEKLFENMMNPEMKKLFAELQKLMEKMDKTKVQETLEKLKLSDKDIEKELDRTLEQFKQMEVQNKMEDVARKLDELAKKQEELSKQTNPEKNQDKKADDKSQENKNSENKNPENKNPDNKNQENKNPDNKTPDNKNNEQKNTEQKAQDQKLNKEQLQQKQEELTKKFDEIKKEMQEMKDLNQKLEEQLPVPDTKQSEQKASEQQQNASQQLQKNNKKNASKSQKEAAQEMEKMSEQMEQASQDQEQQQQEEDMQSIRQILENLLRVSFDQEELAKEVQLTKTSNPRYTNLAKKQKQLQDDSKMIEDSLLALSKRNPKVSASINREITAIQSNMQKAINAFEERNTSEAQMRGQTAMTSINNLALMLNESLEQMRKEEQEGQKKKKGSKSGKGNCKKPGSSAGEGKKPSMASMRQMQEQLNKQIEQMKKILEQQGKQQGGKKPGDKPGQQKGGSNPYGNIPGTSESLAKMAAEQEAIRKAVQEALQKMQKNGGKQPGGDILNKMEETEADLVNKAITQETLKRQQEIMTRMLESEKAQREQEQDEQRKSNEAKQENYTNPALFLEYQKLKEQETELLKTMPPSLTPYYRGKVNQYFNSFVK